MVVNAALDVAPHDPVPGLLQMAIGPLTDSDTSRVGLTVNANLLPNRWCTANEDVPNRQSNDSRHCVPALNIRRRSEPTLDGLPGASSKVHQQILVLISSCLVETR
jgi:hypothetical protein